MDMTRQSLLYGGLRLFYKPVEGMREHRLIEAYGLKEFLLLLVGIRGRLL